MSPLFAKAAFGIHGPESYSRSAQDSVLDDHSFDDRPVCLSLTQWLERANCRRTNTGLKYGPPSPLAEAKAELCRKLKTVHLDVWEHDRRPNWREVKSTLEWAAS